MNRLHDYVAIVAVAIVTHGVAGSNDSASPDSGCDAAGLELTIDDGTRATQAPEVIIGLPREYGNMLRMDTLA